MKDKNYWMSLNHTKNEAYVALDDHDNIVDARTFLDNRVKYYSVYKKYQEINIREDSIFYDIDDLKKRFKKSREPYQISKISFIDTDLSSLFDGEGANLLAYDFSNRLIWYVSKDGTKCDCVCRYVQFETISDEFE